MDYEEFEDVLDEDAEGEANMPADRRAKLDNIHKKVESLMGEAAEVMLDPELLLKIEDKVVRVMSRKKINPTIANLKVFLLAFQFGLASKSALGNDGISIAMGIRHMIDKKEKAKPKMDIDITKSKPLNEPKQLES